MILASQRNILKSDQISICITKVRNFKKARLLFIVGNGHYFNREIQTKVNFQLSFGAITLSASIVSVSIC
ncbi:hypothetical protein [Spiroplasma endosymbiont of Polydrusus formosus]|uniref:hypothetical protein n=1 Tax=Spiroplasma endosymbiont of Polydrusus formosus TaxID=3139326 RepID=UPI0035B51F40